MSVTPSSSPPVPSSPGFSFSVLDFMPVYRAMLASIGANGETHTPLVQRIEHRDMCAQHGIQLDPQNEDIIKNCWIVAHTRHFHGVLVLAWSKLGDGCNPDSMSCSKLILGKTEIRWKQSVEEMEQYPEGDPYRQRFLSLPAAEYIDRALAANHEMLSNSAIVPFVGQPTPDTFFAFSGSFLTAMKEAYKYMLRAYVHIYCHHMDMLPSMFADFSAPSSPNNYPQPLDKFHFQLLFLYQFARRYGLIEPLQVNADNVGSEFSHYLQSQEEFNIVQEQNWNKNTQFANNGLQNNSQASNYPQQPQQPYSSNNPQQPHQHHHHQHHHSDSSLTGPTSNGSASNPGLAASIEKLQEENRRLLQQLELSKNGGGSSDSNSSSQIDPHLIALKRAELIKKGTPPFIAQNLAIARVEADIREGKYPPGYVKPGANEQAKKNKIDEDDEEREKERKRKKKEKKEKERERERESHQRESSLASTDDSPEHSTSKSKASKSQSKRTDDDHDNSSTPSTSSTSAPSTSSSSASNGAAAASSSGAAPAAKQTGPRPRPIQPRQPPQREPSCGQRLCF